MQKMFLIISILLITAITFSREVQAVSSDALGIGSERSCHNFSHELWLPVKKICRTCHIPHQSRRAKGTGNRYAEGLRWDPEIKTHTFSIFNSLWSSSLTGLRDPSWIAPITGRRSGLPDGLSKLCLGCHDGIIAPDVFTLHHFVSLEFDVTRTELRDPDVTPMGVSGPISEVLSDGKIQCSSCHDVHNEETAPGTKLLRVAKDRVCYVCHKR